MRSARVIAVTLVMWIATAGCNDQAPTAEGTAVAQGMGGSSTWHDHPGAGLMAAGDPGTAGGFTVEPFARGSFPDGIDVTFKVKLDAGTTVARVAEPSDALVARLTFQPGGSVGWHTHHGPVIVTIASGALSVVNASDCIHRVYTAGQAFIDPGQGNVHVGYNETSGETVVFATFLDVPAGQPATIPAPDPGCPA